MAATHEMEALWAEVFGEPPSIRAETGVLAEILVAALPLAPPYRAEGVAESEGAAPGSVAGPSDRG